MQRRTLPRGAILLLSLWLAGFILGTALQEEDPNCGTAQLDNDEQDLEIYCADPTMEPGTIRVIDEDRDGDFDRIFVGTKGGGSIFGFDVFDGRAGEVELVVSDPTLPSGRVRSADADSDDDVEVIWVGVQGLDLNGNGQVDPEEIGLIAGFADIDGNGDLEIIVADKARSLGDYFVGGFGFRLPGSDPREVLWVGLLNETQRTTVGSIVSMVNVDGDDDDEVLAQDLRRSPGEMFLDVDGDGDIDILIQGQF
jgi:hypothetical protein